MPRMGVSHRRKPFSPAPFSPAPRDPRFSRITPDKILARCAASQAVAGVFGDASSWVINLIHTKARKTPKFDPVRKQLLLSLARRAEAAEDAAEKKEPEPGAAEAAKPHLGVRQTEVLLPQHQSVFGGESAEKDGQ